MNNIVVPDDIRLAALDSFLAGDRKKDKASIIALSIFLVSIENGHTSVEKARAFLKKDKKVASYISGVSADLSANASEVVSEVRVNLTKIGSDTAQSLADLERMRGEFSGLLGTMHTELTRINTVAVKLEATAADINTRTADTAEIIESRVIKKIDEAIRHAMAAAGNTALRATIKAAVITSAITTVCLGIPSNIGSSFIYDGIRAGKKDNTQQYDQNTKSSDPPTPPRISLGELSGESFLPVERDLGLVKRPQDVSVWKLDNRGLHDLRTGLPPTFLEQGKVTIIIEENTLSHLKHPLRRHHGIHHKRTAVGALHHS